MRINWFSCMIMLCFTIIFCGNLPGNAQSAPVKDLRYYFQAAQQAYAEGQYDAYRENLQEMLRLRPNHPTYLYNLAGANALSGRSDEALAILQRVAAAGLVYPAAEDEDFAPLRSSDVFAAILAAAGGLASPVVSAVAHNGVTIGTLVRALIGPGRRPKAGGHGRRTAGTPSKEA